MKEDENNKIAHWESIFMSELYGFTTPFYGSNIVCGYHCSACYEPYMIEDNYNEFKLPDYCPSCNVMMR